jgi:hypothetical protein
MSKKTLVYYNSDTDEIYTRFDNGGVCWTYYAENVSASVLWCGDCSFWHLIGVL